MLMYSLTCNIVKKKSDACMQRNLFSIALALNIVKNCRDSIIQPMKESTYLNLSSVIGCVKRFLLVTEAHHTIQKKNEIEILKHVVIERDSNDVCNVCTVVRD